MKKQFLGFTLSELLVSLTVIGLIAAFAVPKIIGDTSQNQLRVQIKEALNGIEALAVSGFAEERILENNPASLATFLIANIRNVKTRCPVSVSTAPACTPPGATGFSWNLNTFPGVLLNNNRTMISIDTALTGTDTVYIYVYDLSTGTPRQTRFPLIVGEGNATGGQGSLSRRDTINNTDTTWIYQ